MKEKIIHYVFVNGKVDWRKTAAKKRRAAELEALSEYSRQWRAAHPSVFKESSWEWRTTHPEAVKESLREWRAAKSKALSEYLWEWRAAHPPEKEKHTTKETEKEKEHEFCSANRSSQK